MDVRLNYAMLFFSDPNIQVHNFLNRELLTFAGVDLQFPYQQFSLLSSLRHSTIFLTWIFFQSIHI